MDGRRLAPCCEPRLFATGAAFLAYVALGLLIASLGASFLELQRQTGAAPAQLTFVFTLRSFGYLVGSAAGGVLLDRFPHAGTPTIAVSLFATAISTSLVPSAASVFVLCVLFCTQGIAMGALDTIANVIIIYLWQDGAGPWMQGLHAAFAVGAVISPLVVRLSQSLSATGTSISAAFYAFSVVTGLCGVYFCFVPTPAPREKKIETPEAATSKATTDTAAPPSNTKAGCCSYHFRIILTTGALLGIYVGAETGFGGFVLLYAQNQYGMTEAEGQYVNALFFGCLTLGRLVGIPLSRCLTITPQLVLDLVLSAVGCAVLVTGLSTEGAADAGRAWLWAGAAVFGTGLGTVFPCAVLQAEAFTDLSGRAASVLMVGAAIGEMVVPLCIGVWTAAWAPGFVIGIALTTATFVALAAGLIWQGKVHARGVPAADIEPVGIELEGSGSTTSRSIDVFDVPEEEKI